MQVRECSFRRRRQIDKNRRGLVIREVVLISVLPFILISILLPAVQRAREAARKMTCANNLRQIGLGVASFESYTTKLPPGCSLELPSKELTFQWNVVEPCFNWVACVLPFVELEPAYNSIAGRDDKTILDLYRTPSRAIFQTPIPLFRCPSDEQAPALNIGRSFQIDLDGESVVFALSNYVGNNGSQDIQSYSDGIFIGDQQIRYSEITDGTSNTILAGERAWLHHSDRKRVQSRAALTLATRSRDDHSFYGLADTLAAGRYRINFSATSLADGLGESYARRGYSSNHRGCSNFLFADSHIQSLASTLDSDMDLTTQTTRTVEVDSVWERLTSRNDGGELPSDF